MNYINLLSIFIVSLLMVFKLNYIIRHFSNKDNKNPLKVFTTAIGWPIGLILGALSALLMFVYGLPGYYIQAMDLLLTLLIIAVIDAGWKTIPNYITISLLLSQLLSAYTFAGTQIGIWNAIISIVILAVLMLASKLSKEQIGMGDVKLITVVNLIYGLSFTMYSMIFSLVAMLFFTIPLLIARKLKLKSQIPFAPFYALGVGVYVILNFI